MTLRSQRGLGPALVLLLPLLIHAPAAYGAGSQPGDPPAGSPAGAVYQLPFEKGRADGAPTGNGGTGTPGPSDSSGGAGADSDSYYRSENHFGSSSQVPGAPGGEAGGQGSGGSGGGNGSGSGDGSGGAGTTSGTNAGLATDSGNTSIATNLALLAAIGLIAGAVGFIGLRRRSLNPQ